MRYAAGFVLVVLGVAAAVHYWPQRPEARPTEPPLELPARMTLVQRHDTVVPGSQGRLRVHIGDITRGQVQLTLSHRDGRLLIPPASAREGERHAFSLGGRRYELVVVTLDNKLIGDDSAVLEIYEGRSERERIEQLLESMQGSSVTFIRNGKEYDGTEAAAHLRRKWNAAGDRIQTTEQFIDHIATRSSTSGRPYQLRLADGRTVETSAWLTARLRDSHRPGGAH